MDVSTELVFLDLGIYLGLALVAVAGIFALGPRAGPWLPLLRLRSAPWSGREVLLGFFIYILLPIALVIVLDKSGFFFAIYGRQIDTVRQANLFALPALVLIFAITITLLYATSRTYPRHVGWTRARWRANIRLGLAGFCLATPLVLGLYGLLIWILPRKQQDFERLAQQDLYGFEWALMAVNALLAAPLLEEWFFRGLLQGWLRRASPFGHAVVAVFALTFGGLLPYYQSKLEWEQQTETVESFGFDPSDPDSWDALDMTPAPVLWEPAAFSTVIVAVYLAGVLRLWWPVFQTGLRHFAEQPGKEQFTWRPNFDNVEGQTPLISPEGPRWEAFKHANARWAIVGSTALWALLHGAWPAAVPLVLLGLVLGWLAYRTQSLVPGIVLHALFNTIAVVTLYVATPEPAKGNGQTSAWRPPASPSASSVPGSWLPRRTYANAIACPKRGEITDEVVTPTSASF